MSFWQSYLIFFLKFLTIAIIILAAFIIIALVLTKIKEKEKGGKLVIRSLNDHYQEMADIVRGVVFSKKELKKDSKLKKKEDKEKKEAEKDNNPRLFVINFQGDIRASQVSTFREEITAVLISAKPEKDQVLIRLESGGGTVPGYGLAASQLQRLKAAQIKFTISVDKVAASGGYMMACLANEIIAAPFAIVGSIGVIAQLPNFHRYLDSKHIDFEQIMAGKFKRTLTIFGKNTLEGREKMQEEVDDIHELFKEFIGMYRPQIDLEKVATGEHWFAARAVDLNLIDKLQTSDDYLLSKSKEFDLYEVEYTIKKSMSKKFSSLIFNVTDKLFASNYGH